MNENLDLTEILKDCPKGTKLYSRCLGSVEFSKITLDNYIKIIDKNGYYIRFKPNGIYELSEENAEIDLFPSKDQRDWSKWHRPFVDGDIFVCLNLCGNHIAIYNNAERSNFYGYYVMVANNGSSISIDGFCSGDYYRLATEEEKQKLFDVIKENGYKWNAETKTLEKIKKEKFDPKTLKPFESKVLVSTFSNWKPAIFGAYVKEFVSPIVVVGGNTYTKCIPYEGNEHLIGTHCQPSEFYRYWEE